MEKQITSDDRLDGNNVFNDFGFSATERVVREDVCTYLRTPGNVRTGKYQHNILYTQYIIPTVQS